jgi:tagatose-1,6-bisphosphate aldolase
MLKDLYILLDQVAGVQTVKNVSISNKSGESSGYSKYSYDISTATQSSVIYPSLDPSIFEVKYPDSDIRGKVVPL